LYRVSAILYDAEAMSRIPASRLLTVALLVVVLLYSALLRFDALFKSYGPYDRPQWLAALQPAVTSAASALTPDFRWRRVKVPYVGGDPINYLKFGREMKNFYAAHVREPGFPGATHVTLMLTGDADVAVSLTSIAFALLTLVATFALGCAVGSPAAGLLAAAALGIDTSAIFWSIGGWRDEMFASFAVLNAWAWLRLAQQPTDRRAAIAGVVGGGALLTRITSLSFLVPTMIFVSIGRDPAKRPLRQVGIAAAITAALIAPFIINCAIATGDPLFAIDNHTVFYLNREGTPDPSYTKAIDYTFDKFKLRPITAADTVATGIFFYPFANKWVGLDAWRSGLGRLLAALAIGGLIAWLWQPDGRLLLLMLVCALAPFSVTWTVIGGAEWRLTFFSYAFELLAAFWFLEMLVRRAPRFWTLTRPQILKPLVVVSALVTVFAAWTFAMPYAVVREALTTGSTAIIPAGRRDAWFFDDGWSRLVRAGNVVSRFATSQVATARLLLPEVRPYTLVMRIQPLDVAGPLQIVDVTVNDRAIGRLELAWNAERIGDYRLDVPAEAVRPGLNQLAFRSARMVRIRDGSESFPAMPPEEEVAFRLWYVSIVPR